jgi:hypothetical protein
VTEAQRFIRKLAALPEAPMRVALWREAFAGAPPERLFEIVAGVLDAIATTREPSAEVVYFALVEYLEATRGQPDEGRRGLYEAAHAAGNLEVMRLLFSRPAAKVIESEPPAPVLKFDREVTLGERRSLARSLDRNVLDRLLADADLGVLRNLLANPRLIEADVLRIASRRPTTAAALTLLFRHPKWGRRRAVQKALAFNPYTPSDIAVALVALLEPADWRSLSTDGLVHASVRERSRVLLDQRRRQTTPPVIEIGEDQ